MSEEVSSKVKKIVADHLGIEEAKVTEESSFIDDLGADSLIQNLSCSRKNLDLKFQIVRQKILTVGDAIKFIESKSN